MILQILDMFKQDAIFAFISYRQYRMISFRYKSSIRQIKIKTKKDLADRMPPWLQHIFSMKNPVVGFKVTGNKYYDAESFYARIDKFYGQIVDIIEANDQLEISFISDNLNSSSFLKPNHPNIQTAKQYLPDEYRQQPEQQIRYISDAKALEQRLQDNNALTIFFDVHQIYKKEVAESISQLKHNNGFSLNLYMRNYSGRGISQPVYSIYIGRRLIATLNLTREYKQTIHMVIERYDKSNLGEQRADKFEKGEEKQYIYKGSNDQENDAPSFTTYQLQERLNQDACQDYLLRMYQQKILKKYEYLKLSQKCEENFVEFYRIFCEGAIDNDYENFRNQILVKVENNLEILLSNVDEMDLSRPISREEQRRQNLKKSVSNIQIVKVQNYFEILDQLKPNLTPKTLASIKTELLDEDQVIFSLFADYLSRNISREELIAGLQSAIQEKDRPKTRGFQRSRSKFPSNQSDDQIGISPIIKRTAEPIKFFGSTAKQQKGNEQKNQKNQVKQTPPMFGSSKNNGNFSPMKYMSDIESNYKQAWSRLQNKAHLFEPEQYGLLYHYLQVRDDRISNIIQQLEWDEPNSIKKLKEYLSLKMNEIIHQNFTDNQIIAIEMNKKETQFDCIYQNFKYESDLSNFISCLKSEVNYIIGSPVEKVMKRKKSDSQLLGDKEKKKSKRRYSDEQQKNGLQSPKQSSFSHEKTIDPSIAHLSMLNSLWSEQFQELLKYCGFDEQHKQDYVRQAFKNSNPAIYHWIYKFVRSHHNEINKQEIKKDSRFGDQDYRLISKAIPIFNEIMKILIEEGKITERIKEWHIAQLADFNPLVLSIFECLISTGNEEEFVENLILSFENFNKEMYFYKLYLKRIETVLKQMSAHDQIGLEVFRLYPNQIKAMCELFYVTGDTEDLLENLDILHSIQVNNRKLKVSTLNFSGINTNPLQYHDGSDQFQSISQNVKQIVQKPQIMEYISAGKTSKIDKNFTNNSVSIRFGTNCLDANGKLMNKQEYFNAWSREFNQKVSQEVKQQSKENQDRLATIDYYCYIGVIKHFFNDIEFNENYEIPNVKQLDPQPMISFLNEIQQRPASKIQVKQQMVFEYLMKNDIDVLFLQEGGSIDWGQELIETYSWIKNHDSVIIFKKNKIGKLRNNKEIRKFAQKLDFNHDTAFYFSDRGYLLISAHLTSKKNKQQQGENVFNVLKEIQDEHPLLKIIVGIDANHFMKDHNTQGFSVIPATETQSTSTKKRTFIQTQFHKADVLTSAVKDHIITNLDVKQYVINDINDNKVEENILLPNKDHPYDHLIVSASL